MSTLDFTLLLSGVERGVAGRASSPLRMVLVEGEALSLPPACTRLSILSGTAWITQAGQDTVLRPGSFFGVSASSDRAVISTLGSLPLCFEMRGAPRIPREKSLE